MKHIVYRRRDRLRGSCALLCLLMLLTLLPLSAAGQKTDEQTVRVGSFNGTYNIVNEKGERSGYGYEYLQDIAGYAGWAYDYVDSSWETCFAQLESGEIDVLGGISYTEDRAEKMLFSDLPMGEEKYYIYTDASHARFSAADLRSFEGAKIGVLKDHIPETVLNVWEEKHGLHLQHVNVTSLEETLVRMDSGEIDCFVSTEDSTWETVEMLPITHIGQSNIYFAINRNHPEIKDTLDSAMRRIRDDNPFYADDLYRRYLSTTGRAFLTAEEKQWLDSHGRIRIGYLHNDTGVSVWEPETGKLTGVITDYVELARNCLQSQTLDFELRGYDSREGQLEALHSGEIDLIFHVSQNPYSAEKNKFVLSDTVWTFNIAAITTRDNFNETDAIRVAVCEDNLALRAYISYNYPQWTVYNCETNQAALKAMRTGKADCVLTNSGMVSGYLRNKRFHGFFLTKQADASFGIRQGEPMLLSIMNKTLMSVPTAKLSGALVSYSNASQKTTVADFFRDNAGVALVFLLLLVAIVCGFWADSVCSGREAKKLNGELEKQKDKLEDALLAANQRGEIIGAISRIYNFIYQFNLRDGTYEEVSPDPNIQELAGSRGVFREAKERVIRGMVAEEYRPIMMRFVNFDTIAQRLQDTDSIAIEYRTPQNTWQMARMIVKNRDEQGNATEVLYTVRQIDKQKQQENQYKQKLLFSSRVLSGLSTDYTIAIVLNLDTDEYRIAFNQSTNNVTKVNPTETFREFVERFTERFTLPEYRDAMRQTLSSQVIRKRFASEKDYHFSFETLPNAAGLSCFQVHIVKEYDEGGHFAFLGFRSVDEAIRQERKYKQLLQNQLDLITASLPGGVKISNDDPTYSFKYVSEQFAAMLGYDSPEELMKACGGSIMGLVHPDDFETGLADALDQYSRADNYATTYRMHCKDGSYKYVEDRGRKVTTSAGTVEHWNLILDKNDLMEKTIALESERKANQSKSAFLARMSHDMRTPLNGIIGLMKINLDHFGDTKLALENYRKMQISADHLLSLINDVLQMSKIEDGTVPLTHEVINLIELARDVETMVETKAAEEGIRLKFENRKTMTRYPYIYGSPLHLRQIFLNIYGNCIKYNRPGGSITTAMDYQLDDQGRCVYEWVISDTGIGMSKEFLEHIFESFVQEKDDARSVYQGTGLGMAIVKGLVDKMGGTIAVESKLNVGSTFTVRIPFEIANAEAGKPGKVDAPNEDIRGMKLLLAEDNELNAEIAQTLLEDAGAVVTLAQNGARAVETFQGNAPGAFDAILMDIMMPVMNGYEATRAIRALDRPDAKKIPIIAMTANAFTEDAEKCIEAGMNAHLSKPLEIAKVKQVICSYVNQRKP